MGSQLRRIFNRQALNLLIRKKEKSGTKLHIDRSDVGVTNDSSEEEAVNRQALFLEPNEENAGYKAAQAFALHVTELPEDVLRIIFDLMCQSGSGARLTISTHPAMVLSYVCSAWRRIILEMPHVWSRLGVSLRIKFT
ncbi:hypothetical protein F5887DRAFT_971279, partial [Amanita rubescens]